MDPTEPKRSQNFIEQIIEDDNRTGKWGVWPGTDRPRVHTRFPPEPNGYLHIGHAKSICLNYGLAVQYGGKFNLRFDDTNPEKEEEEYVRSITEDVRWLGADWQDRLLFASDYYEQMYQWAEELVQKRKAYVCDLSAEEVRQHRGTLTAPGRESPYRNRTPAENLDLLRRMRAGEFPDGSRTLRARIDMAHPNLNMRDPVMYRIVHAKHHRTGDAWCIYPMYDWAHGFEDSIEGITHSICTLEFEDHRPLYDWFIDAVNEGRGPGSPWGMPIHHPQQIEFARLDLNYTVMSKRKLLELVKGAHVRGWDDPRMPTISGMRRRGFTPEAIQEFCRRVGVAKFNSTIDVQLLEHCVREDLNKRAMRVMAVMRPLRVVIENYPEGQVEQMEAVNNPEDPSAGTRQVPFSRVLYIEQEDFREEPPPKFFRLSPGREVRLRYAYFITCREAIKDPKTGEVVELRCTYDPATRGGDAPDGRKVKATLHWVSAEHALPAEVRLYEHLFSKPDPNDVPPGGSYLDNLNPHSMEVLTGCWVEPSVAGAAPGTRYQFERQGYFCVDPDSTEGAGSREQGAGRDGGAEGPLTCDGRFATQSGFVAVASQGQARDEGRGSGGLVFNRTVSLKDTWAKIEKKG